MRVLSHNKYALYNYELVEQFTAGAVLLGWEVKSIKNSRMSLKESYIGFKDGRLFLIGAHVAAWPGVKITTLDEYRDKELLLHNNELAKIRSGLGQKGNTAVVLDVLQEKSRVKFRIGLVRGKKAYDKRAKLKEEDQKREIERDLKHYDMLK